MQSLSKKSISPFLETIRIEKGEIHNLLAHQARLDQTRQDHWPNQSLAPIDLKKMISPPDNHSLYRCRILYDHMLRSIEYIPYQIRPIHTLKLVECATLDYRYKSSDRSAIDRCFSLRGDADDCLITQAGILTDTSIANIALLNDGIWYTPKTPLLKGTAREKLLNQGKIIEERITIDDLERFSHITLFNAMIDFKQIILPISAICRS